MLKELKFVMGAVAKKDFVATMTHFNIHNGQVRSYNGTIALSSPITFTVNCKPKAQQLVQAISKCDDTIVLALDKQKLMVQSGAFRAYVDCTDEPSPDVLPEGEDLPIDGETLLDCFKKLEDFIGTDASRPWASGLLLRDGSAFATNNVMIVQYWLGHTAVPHSINIPRQAIIEMIRLNEAPIRAQYTANSVTFHYADGRWIRTQLLTTDWPDIAPLLDRESTPVPIPEGLFQGIETIKAFCGKDGYIYFRESGITTDPVIGAGAFYSINGFNLEGCYRHEVLLKLKGVAKAVDFSAYPLPCTFTGDRLRGVFTGIRQ